MKRDLTTEIAPPSLKAPESVSSTPSRSGITEVSGPPVFWLNGSAGTGKSTIAYTIAKKFSEAGILAASFFSSRDDAKCSNHKLIFPTIAYQLAQFHPEFGQQLAHVVKAKPEIVQADISYQLQELIMKPLASMGELATSGVIVIDALDECKDNSTVSVILAALSAHVERLLGLKIFVTSRPERNINLAFDDTALQGSSNHFVLHEIEPSIVEADITTYLSDQLEIVKKQYEIEEAWPSEADTDLLSKRSCGLFIFAATSIKFIIDKSYDDPRGQLLRILSNTTPLKDAESDPRYQLDRLYLQVLTDAHPNPSPKLAGQLKMLMGTIVLLFDPLSLGALQRLLNHMRGQEFEDCSIRQTLMRLHSIIIVPKDEGQVIRTLHPSFFDFIVDSKRCTNPRFFVDVGSQHATILTACLRTMQSLKRNICKLPDFLAFNSEIPDLPERVVRYMPAELQYACRHWCAHLKYSIITEENLELLGQFTSQNLVFWVEACSLLGDLRNQLVGLDAVQRTLVKRLTSDSVALILLNDCERLIREFFSVISASWVHLYNLALPFSPKESALRLTYSTQLLVKVIGGPEKWNACSRTMEGHTDQVNSIAFSPDGSRVASGSWDKTIRLWDAVSGAHLSTLNVPEDMISSVAFSPDGRRIASGSFQSNIHLWDTSGRFWKVLKGHSDAVRSVAWSSDGDCIASGSDDKTVRLWNVSSGAQLFCFQGHSSYVNAVAFSPSNDTILSGSYDGSVRFWNLTSGEPAGVLEGHSDKVSSVTFSPNGTCIASGSYDRTVRLWDVNKAAKQRQVLRGHTDSVHSVAFSPDGSIIASASRDGSIRLWDARSGACISTLEGHSNGVKSLAFSPDGTRIASGSHDKTVRLWIVDHAVTRPSDSKPSSFSLQAFSPSNIVRNLLRNDSQNKSDMNISRSYSNAVTRLFSPDATMIATTSRDGTDLSLWDAATGKHLITLARNGKRIVWRSLVFSGDSTRVAAALNNRIHLWDTGTGKTLQVLQGHTARVTSCRFSPDGTKIASVADDHMVRLWDAMNGSILNTLQYAPVYEAVLAFSPDGTRIAIKSHQKNDLVLWDFNSAGNGMIEKALQEDSIAGYCTSIDFSPDGRHLVLATFRTLHLLDSVSGQTVRQIECAFYSPPLWMPFSEEYADLGAGENDSRIWANIADRNTKFYYFMQDGWVWFAHPRRRLCLVPLESRAPYLGTLISSQFRVAWTTESGRSLIIDFSEILDTDGEGNPRVKESKDA